MKIKLLLVNLIVIFSIVVKAQYVSIPDSNFRNYLFTKYPSCFNAAKQMDTTCTAIVNETQLMANNTNFTSIDGIEYFDNLKDLNVEYNNIASIYKLPTNLITLNCSFNKLTGLPSLPINLKKLNCSVNSILTLPVLPNSLTFLEITGNKVSALPVLPNSIDTLRISSNLLTVLPTSLPPNLSDFQIQANYNISVIPNLPSSLKYFECGSTNITSLP